MIVYHSIFSSKNSRNPVPVSMMSDGTQHDPYQKRIATDNYPPSQPKGKRKQWAKHANKSLVTKISDKQPSNPIPDVIASHEGHVSSEATSPVPEMVNGTTENGAEERAGTYDIPDLKGIRTAEKDNNKASSSNVVEATANNHVAAVIEDVAVQVHRPSSLLTDESDGPISMGAKPRKSSFTHSEKEAVGTLDDVLRDFDLDDNLNVSSTTEQEANDPKPYQFDRTYETFDDIKESITTQENAKPTGTDGMVAMPQTQSENKLAPPKLPEPVYAKPFKPKTTATSSANKDGYKQTSERSTEQATEDKLPVVPPKKFVVEDHEHKINFSPLRKSSPSACLSQSLNRTDWANANDNHTSPKRSENHASPKRRPIEDNNNNFILKRGELSGPAPRNTDEDYVEPPRDYDANGTLSSIGQLTSISDESFTRDTWGSLTSSSTSGSRKVKKEIRPEAMRMIQKKKAQKERADVDGRQHDRLVNRSFKMIRQASLKDTASKSSLKEDEANQSDLEKDFAKIKNDADTWLENYERLRANSEGKKSLNSGSGSPAGVISRKDNGHTSTTKVENSSPVRNENGQTPTMKAENVLPTNTATPSSDTAVVAVDETKLRNDVIHMKDNSLGTVATANDVTQRATEINKESTNAKAQNPSEINDDSSLSDDENLIRMMETGIGAEETYEKPLPPQNRFGYVPRAMRMSFGQSWEGIRRDRREWKTREMKQITSNALRKGTGNRLSNRLDDQEAHLEMLF